MDCLVTALERVAHFGAEAIEPDGPRALEPLHAEAQVWFRSFHRQVKVISHDDEGMQPPEKAISPSTCRHGPNSELETVREARLPAFRFALEK